MASKKLFDNSENQAEEPREDGTQADAQPNEDANADQGQDTGDSAAVEDAGGGVPEGADASGEHEPPSEEELNARRDAVIGGRFQRDAGPSADDLNPAFAASAVEPPEESSYAGNTPESQESNDSE